MTVTAEITLTLFCIANLSLENNAKKRQIRPTLSALIFLHCKNPLRLTHLFHGVAPCNTALERHGFKANILLIIIERA